MGMMEIQTQWSYHVTQNRIFSLLTLGAFDLFNISSFTIAWISMDIGQVGSKLELVIMRGKTTI